MGGIAALSIFFVLSNVLTAVLTGWCIYKRCAPCKTNANYIVQSHGVHNSGKDVASTSLGYDDPQRIQGSIDAHVPVKPNPAYQPSGSNILITSQEYMTPNNHAYAVPRHVENESSDDYI